MRNNLNVSFKTFGSEPLARHLKVWIGRHITKEADIPISTISMKTIKLSYKVKNFLYPFRVVLVSFEVNHSNPREVEWQFAELLRTLVLSADEDQIIRSLNINLKFKFLNEHKKVLETRKDFIGDAPIERSAYFERVLKSPGKKGLDEYRRYLCHCQLLTEDEMRLFLHSHLSIVLDQLHRQQQADSLSSHLHVIEMFVEKEALLQDIESYREAVVTSAVKSLKVASLETRNRALRVLNLLCYYFEETFPLLFEALRKEYQGQPQTKLNYLLALLDTQNLFQVRSLVKFLLNLLQSATTNRNFLKLITLFIDSELLEKLESIRTRINERKYRIYESYDECSNLEVLDLNSHTPAKIEQIYLENDNDFTVLKKEVLSDIKTLQNRFNETLSGKAATKHSQSPVKQKRSDLIQKHYRRSEKTLIVNQSELIKKHSGQHIKQEARPFQGDNKSVQYHSDPTSAPSTNQFLDCDDDDSIQHIVQNLVPTVMPANYLDVIAGYEYKLLEKANEIDRLQDVIKELMETRKIEADLRSKLKEFQINNERLQEEIQELRSRLEEREIVTSMQQAEILGVSPDQQEHQPIADSRRSKRRSSVMVATTNIVIPPSHHNVANAAAQTEKEKAVDPIIQQLEKEQRPKNGMGRQFILPPPPLLFSAPVGNDFILPLPPQPPAMQGLTAQVDLPPPPSIGLPSPPPIGLLLPPSLPGLPPLLGALNFSGPPRKPRPVISTPLKPLHWSIIEKTDIKGTLWQDMEEAPVNITEIEQLFGSKKLEIQKAVVATTDKKSLIPLQRTRNIELIVRKLKLNLDSLRKACYEFDERYLDYGMTMSLLQIHPFQKEIELFQGAKLDEKELPFADRYLYCVCNIKGFELRLRGMKFKADYPEMQSEFSQKLEYFTVFFKEVREDKLLLAIIKYCLSIGNVLNAEGPRGGAYAFKLDTLEKCFDIHYESDRKTLMSYILTLIKTNDPEAVNWRPTTSEYTGLIISYQTLAGDLKSMKESLSLIHKCMDEIEEGSEDCMQEYFLKFYMEATNDTKKLTQRLALADKTFKQCQGFYGEKLDSERFMQMIIGLRTRLKKELLSC